MLWEYIATCVFPLSIVAEQVNKKDISWQKK